jgi:hypothetical protein
VTLVKLTIAAPRHTQANSQSGPKIVLKFTMSP